VSEPSWTVRLASSARRDIKRLDPPVRERILAAIEGLCTQPPAGDIKRLTSQPPEWRLRVGVWRVRFTRDPDTRSVLVQRVLPRGRAYRD
jgi:mRNA interferase RelE/StbE